MRPVRLSGFFRRLQNPKPKIQNRHRLGWVAAFATVLCLSAAGPAPADDARLYHVKLLTDAEPDVTSVEDILASVVKPGMSDEEKCRAAFRFVYEHRFWYPAFAPVEMGHAVSDPVLLANCFPTTICQQDASATSALWAGLGYDVRYWQLGGHTTGEVFYAGQWHCFDATNGRTTRDKDGAVGGVEINERFYKPGVSAVTPWDDYEISHHMDLTLRRGETFTRSWSPLGTTNDYWRAAGKDKMPDERKDSRLGLAGILAKKPYTFDPQGAGFANGIFELAVDAKDPRWTDAFERVENVAADGAAGKLAAKDPAKPGEIVYRMRTPYIITGAWVEADGRLPALDVSTSGGRTWHRVETPGAKVALRGYVAGRFDYLLKLTLAAGESVSGLKLTTVVQVNPLSLPALHAGENKVRLSAGEQADTLTWTPDLGSAEYREGIVSEENIETAREGKQDTWVQGLCAREGGKESTLVLRFDAPGDLRRVRWGGRLRTFDGCANEMSWSLDGKAWIPQPMSARWTYPASPVKNGYVAYDETTPVPPGFKTVWLKYRFLRPVPAKDPSHLHLATELHAFADFAPPPRPGAPAVEITYSWSDKTDTHLVRPLPAEYTIALPGDEKPMMHSVKMRLLGETNR